MDNLYSPEWYATFSDTIPPEQTEAEVTFVAGQLPVARYRRLLDLGCGRGRHALGLARMGYDVTGIDGNAEAIAAASAASDGRATFRVHDMRRLDRLRGTFDGAICMWQSFGYYAHRENRQVLRSLHDRLRPNGRMVLDVYHRAAAARLPLRETARRGQVEIETTRSWDGPRLRVELRYPASGTLDVFEWHVYSLEELRAMAVETGWRVRGECAFWDPDRPVTPDDLRVQYIWERAG